ncbi:MAG TPA: DUF4168 domain-containing protein [Thermosynechococcaceae cyanobacterium]
MNSSPRRLQFPCLSQVALIGALSTVGVLSGLVPQLAHRSLALSFESAALAQSNNQIEKYAKVAYKIELLRQQLYQEAREKMGGNTPANLCQQPNLPGSVAAICQRFSQKSGEIVASERDGEFNEGVFNDITRRKAGDPGLQRRINEAIGRIQGGR